MRKKFTAEEAKNIGEQLRIDWTKFDVEQFRMGMDVELEHGSVDSNTNVTDDDPLMTGKIALAHLNEFPDYYTRLYKMEQEATLCSPLLSYLLSFLLSSPLLSCPNFSSHLLSALLLSSLLAKGKYLLIKLSICDTNYSRQNTRHVICLVCQFMTGENP